STSKIPSWFLVGGDKKPVLFLSSTIILIIKASFGCLNVKMSSLSLNVGKQITFFIKVASSMNAFSSVTGLNSIIFR
ncbi:CLUMA_CG016597, isoform A, partial [Clunio marinus]